PMERSPQEERRDVYATFAHLRVSEHFSANSGARAQFGGSAVIRLFFLAAALVACGPSRDDASVPSPSLPPAPTLADPAPGGGDAGAADAALEPPSSGGRGGLPCTRTEELGEGRTSCVTNVGTVELKIVQPNGGSGPLRLGLYIHGDGAAAHKS